MSTDRSSTTVLAVVHTEAEAAMMVQALESQGIPAQYVGALTSGFRAEVPGEVSVMVHTENVSRAREVLNELRGG